jgi:hypothetical protein
MPTGKIFGVKLLEHTLELLWAMDRNEGIADSK